MGEVNISLTISSIYSISFPSSTFLCLLTLQSCQLALITHVSCIIMHTLIHLALCINHCTFFHTTFIVYYCAYSETPFILYYCAYFDTHFIAYYCAYFDTPCTLYHCSYFNTHKNYTNQPFPHVQSLFFAHYVCQMQCNSSNASLRLGLKSEHTAGPLLPFTTLSMGCVHILKVKSQKNHVRMESKSHKSK